MNTFNKTVPTVRFMIFAITLLAFLFLAPREAHATKLLAEMTPDNLQHAGFTMKAEDQKDGTIAFTLTRDTSKARTLEPSSGLQLRRSAALSVSSKSGLIASCRVEPSEKSETVTYRFVVAATCVPDSRFTLSEVDDYKEVGQEGLIGGGTIFEFRLANFAERSTPKKAPK